MVGLEHLRRYAGAPHITPEIARPFLDMEKDRQRQMQMRLFAGPLGAFATHAVPVVPMDGHVQPLSTAVPQMLGMTGEAPAAGGSALHTIFDNLGPSLAMGSLGAGGAVLASYLASKLWNRFFSRKPTLKTAEQAILNESTEPLKEPPMHNVRLLKFAAVGAHEGKVPVSLVGAVKMAAFTLGLMQESLEGRQEKLANEELSALSELDGSIKTAGAILGYLRGQTAELCKIATVEVAHIAKAAEEGALDLDAVLTESRTKVASAEEMTGLSEIIAIPQGIMSKMGKSLDMLAVSPETAAYIEQGNPIGLTTGVLALLAA